MIQNCFCSLLAQEPILIYSDNIVKILIFHFIPTNRLGLSGISFCMGLGKQFHDYTQSVP